MQKELLKNDSLSVKEVAKTVGYEDAYHFSKLFKNIMENLLHNFKIKNKESSASLRPFPCFATLTLLTVSSLYNRYGVHFPYKNHVHLFDEAQ